MRSPRGLGWISSLLLLTGAAAAQEAPPAEERPVEVRGVLSIERQRTRLVAGRAVQDATLGLRLHLREAEGPPDEAGARRVEVTIEAVRGEVEARMVGIGTPRLRFDSRAAPEGPLAPLAALVGQTFRYRTTAEGGIEAVEGGDALRALLARASAEAGGPPGTETMLARLGASLGDASLAATLDLLRRPPPAADPNARWRVERSDPLPDLGLLEHAVVYEREGERVTLALDGPARLAPDPEAAGEGAHDVRIRAVTLEGAARLTPAPAGGERVVAAEVRREVEGSARAFLGARLALRARDDLRWTLEPDRAPEPSAPRPPRYF